jgi:hypothetical protein
MRIQAEGSQCSNSTSCHCEVDQVLKQLQYQHLNMWVSVTNVTMVQVGEGTRFNPFHQTRKLLRTPPEDRAPTTIYALFQSPLLSVTTTGSSSDHWFVLLQMSSWTELASFQGTSWSYTLKAEQRLVSGELCVSFYNQDGQRLQDFKFPVVGANSCEFHDCFLCKQVWNNWSCLPFSYKTGVVIFWLILALLLLIIVPYLFLFLAWIICSLFKCMRFGCCCLTSIPKTRFAKDASGATTKTVAKVHNYFLKPIDKRRMMI